MGKRFVTVATVVFKYMIDDYLADFKQTANLSRSSGAVEIWQFWYENYSMHSLFSI